MALTAGPMGGIVGYVLPAGASAAPNRATPGCAAGLNTSDAASFEEIQYTCCPLPAVHRRSMLFSSPYLPHNLGNDGPVNGTRRLVFLLRLAPISYPGIPGGFLLLLPDEGQTLADVEYENGPPMQREAQRLLPRIGGSLSPGVAVALHAMLRRCEGCSESPAGFCEFFGSLLRRR